MREPTDFDAQMRLLTELRAIYPGKGDTKARQDWITPEQMAFHLRYLQQHGFVEVSWMRLMSGEPDRPNWATITAAGIDFISSDGGLTAVKNIVTVRLHEDTIRDILIQKVQQAPGDETVKGKLVKELRSLPTESLRAVYKRALESGLDKMPDIIQQAQTWLGF